MEQTLLTMLHILDPKLGNTAILFGLDKFGYERKTQRSRLDRQTGCGFAGCPDCPRRIRPQIGLSGHHIGSEFT